MSKHAIATDKAPAAIGPYSQGVRAGNLIFTAGQIPLDPATGQVVVGGISEQTTRVLDNLLAILSEAGSTLSQVIKTTVYLKNMSDFAAMNTIYGAYFLAPGNSFPCAPRLRSPACPRMCWSRSNWWLKHGCRSRKKSIAAVAKGLKPSVFLLRFRHD